MACTLTILIIGVVLTSSCPAQASTRAASDDEILRALMPNGQWPDLDSLKKFKRADEIRALRAAQATATGERANSIIWLLAALKYRYAENRRRLLTIESNCYRLSYPENGQCYELSAERLIDLFRRGDNSLLKYLFGIWPHS